MALKQIGKPVGLIIVLIIMPTLVILKGAEDKHSNSTTKKEKIIETIKQLSSTDFKTRESATQNLWKLGKSAEPFLREAIIKGNAELKYRGNKVLEEFELGLYPDTPKEIAELIKNYRSGNASQKEAAIVKMAELGQTKLLMKLVRRERNPGIRKLVAQIVSRNISEQIPKLILEDNLNEVSELLEVAALDQTGMRNFASFLVETKRIDLAIQNKRKAAKSSDIDTEILAWMLRANGDSKEAAEIFEKLGDKTRSRHSLSAGGDLRSYANSFVDPTRKTIDSLGFAAAAARLSGDKDRLQEISKRIEEYGMAMKDELGRCINALVINGEVKRAFSLTKKAKGKELFDMEMWRYNFDSAFNAIGITEKKGPYTNWLNEYEKSFKFENEGVIQSSLFPAGQLASACYLTGQIDEARRIMDRVKGLLIKNNVSLVQLIQWERIIGLEVLAKKHALEAMQKEPSADIIEGYFQLRSEYSWLGRTCWAFLESKFSKEPIEKKLHRMESLFDLEDRNQIEIKLADECIKQFLIFAKKEKNLAKKKELIRGARDLTILHEKWQLAVEATEIWLELIGVEAVGYHFMKYGDTLLKAGMNEKAASQYDKAWKSNPSEPLPLYLKGVAMDKAGKKLEARKLKSMASIMATGEVTKRHFLANAMWQNNDDELARAQDEIILRIASPKESVHPEALRRQYVDNSLNSKDLNARLKSLEFYMLSKMRPVNANSVLSPRSTLSYLIDAEITKAKIEISNKKPDKAQERIQKLQEINSSDSSMLEDTYQLLVDAGNEEGANQIFKTTYEVSQSTINRFPNHGQHNNNHAWLLSRCGKQLDEALIHAEKAVKLEPKNGAFLDTLAEVHFQLGNRPKAIEISEKAVQLLGDDIQVKRQLERFRSGKPSDR